jgi:formiminoglutamase
VTNGRFKGGYTTRHYGKPAEGIHAVQMELACRGYLNEPPAAPDEDNWPAPWDAAAAYPMEKVLTGVLQACLRFAGGAPEGAPVRSSMRG